MQILTKEGIALAYKDSGTNYPAIVLVHGWGCDHTVFAAQEKFFGNTHRVITVDLRGHGESDAPEGSYTMAEFADDLAWLCHKLSLVKPVLVGHSMGGNVLLELAARYPDTPDALILIDSVLFPSQTLLNTLRPLAQALTGPGYLEAYRMAMSSLFLSADDEEKKTSLISYIPRAPQHVLLSSFIHHLMDYDPASAASGCHVPIAYLGATVPLADLFYFKGLTPQLMVGQTLGSGHFSPVFVPDQIHAMIVDFMKVYVQ
jgi:pimeloyl-ACP methyl ester carboxylesterase